MRLLVFAVLVGCSSPAPRGETIAREEPERISDERSRHTDAEASPGAPATPLGMESEGVLRPRDEPVHPVEPPPPAPEDAKLGAGSPCLTAAECESGICEGHGCTDSTPGTCAPAERPCTRDRRPYCGCDGETFYSSGSCPGRRYARRGTCGDPVR